MQPLGERRTDEVPAVDVAAAAVLDPAQLELGVAEHPRRRALRDRVEADLVEVAGGDVLVASDEVGVVQPVVEHRMVVAHDPVVGVRVPGEFGAVEDARVDQRRAVGRGAHVVGLPDRQRREVCGAPLYDSTSITVSSTAWNGFVTRHPPETSSSSTVPAGSSRAVVGASRVGFGTDRPAERRLATVDGLRLDHVEGGFAGEALRRV